MDKTTKVSDEIIEDIKQCFEDYVKIKALLENLADSIHTKLSPFYTVIYYKKLSQIKTFYESIDNLKQQCNFHLASLNSLTSLTSLETKMFSLQDYIEYYYLKNNIDYFKSRYDDLEEEVKTFINKVNKL
jgi:ribosome-interacting GTPase 1